MIGGETNLAQWRGVQPVWGIAGIWPARDAVRVHESKENDAEGIEIVYTVPANKKFFMSNAVLNSYLSAAQEERSYIGVRDDGDVMQYYVLELRFGVEGQLVVSDHFVPALEAEAGWDVVLVNVVI